MDKQIVRYSRLEWDYWNLLNSRKTARTVIQDINQSMRKIILLDWCELT